MACRWRLTSIWPRSPRPTPGLVGADLRNLVNEAALLAARRERNNVTRMDFFDAMEKIVLGPERALVMNAEDRRRVAYHESGHALVGLLVPEADPVQRVTIVPRGQALGVTYSRPLDDIVNYTEPYLRARIQVALGGRIAEEIIFNVTSTGAENDIKQATNLARQMVVRWGMSPKVGLVSLASRGRQRVPGRRLRDGPRARRRHGQRLWTRRRAASSTRATSRRAGWWSSERPPAGGAGRGAAQGRVAGPRRDPEGDQPATEGTQRPDGPDRHRAGARPV